MAALEQDPGRVYCVESVFFLKLYWERHPEHRERAARRSSARGQLRILTSSLTTPDTLLPHPEAILRDFHLGQSGSQDNGLAGRPTHRVLPRQLRSLAAPAVAHARRRASTPWPLTRIDGMYFIAADYRREERLSARRARPRSFCRKSCKTLDFVWRDDDGAEVLCHWNAFTYFQGDMLAHVGRRPLERARRRRCLGARARHIARRIDGFVRQLGPLAARRTCSAPSGWTSTTRSPGSETPSPIQ